mgnify:CR=1 FL=1
MFDICIIGGGIVGLATSYQLSQKFPKLSVAVIEKESSLAKHQTGHNSGVLHTGIYYKPGSLKAINCRNGKKAMEQFCKEYGIEHELCGKIIIALNDEEIPRMLQQSLWEAARGHQRAERVLMGLQVHG